MATFEQELEEARLQEETFTATAKVEGEKPTVDARQPEEITLETFMRAQATIQGLLAEIASLKESNFRLAANLDACVEAGE